MTFFPHRGPKLSALPGLPASRDIPAQLQTDSLLKQTLNVFKEYLPSLVPALTVVDHTIPMPLKQLFTEAPLNRLFAEAIANGEFDEFEGRKIRLEIDGGQPGVTLGFWAGRLRVLSGTGDATIRGSFSAFKTLAERKQDPDQLFFQRRLVIEGDTELGLGLKNLLDSLDWNLKQIFL